MKKFSYLAILLLFMLCIHVCSFADSVTLPGDLATIEEEAFYQDTSITEVVIPDGTNAIDARAFANSGLQIIYIPESVSIIDPSTFNGLSDNFIIFAPLGSAAYHHAMYYHYNWSSWPEYNDFMAWMLPQYDTNGDGLFNLDEIAQVTSINCSEQGFTTLDGIEAFYNLESLNCFHNELTSLNVSKNTQLIYLSCAGNRLSALDVTHNPKLVSLSCGESLMDGSMYGIPYGNQITQLDVSNNPLLEVLWCPHNEIAELDVSHNPELIYLGCFDNQITALNTSMNPKLQRLLPGDNPIGTIDVSRNIELYQLNCYDNGLTSLDLSHNSKLTFLWCNDNYLSSIDLSNLTRLQNLNCSGNGLTSLDLSHNTSLITLNCSYNQLTGINVKSCTALEVFMCNSNNLTSLDVSSNRELQSLQLWFNQLTSINLSQNTALTSVNLSANLNLSTLVLGNTQNLKGLFVQNTSLSELDIRNAPIILEIYRIGTRLEFYGDGNVAEAGAGSFYGYMYGDEPSQGGREINRCSLCFDKNITIITDGTDIKESYTITSDIGDSFVVDSIIDTGNSIIVRCSVMAEYSAQNSSMFIIRYGEDHNGIYSAGIPLDSLKHGFTYSFSKAEITQHGIPPVISLYSNLKESYTVNSDIGDRFTVNSIVDTGENIDVICFVVSDYSSELENPAFSLCYGIVGNMKYRDGISLEELKQGFVCSFSKAEIMQHDIPPLITLYVDLKESYTIVSDIGENFVVQSITDTGTNILVRCYVLSGYSADSNPVFTLNYGVDGNCIHRDGISLEALKRGYWLSFSKDTINRYTIPPVITLRESGDS